MGKQKLSGRVQPEEHHSTWVKKSLISCVATILLKHYNLEINTIASSDLVHVFDIQ